VTPIDLSQALQEIAGLLRGGQFPAAVALCRRFLPTHPGSAPLQLLASQAFQQVGDFDGMLACARQAAAAQPSLLEARLRLVEAGIYCGQTAAAADELASLERRAGSDPALMQRIAEMYLRCANHVAANRCYRSAVELRPDDARYVYNLASSCVAMGAIDEAETHFDRVITLDPTDVGAYHSRSTLRTWSTDNNHIGELTELQQRLPESHPGQVPLCYAIAKEYEDLGEFERSFDYVRRGAQRRRAMLGYQVGGDVDAMRRIEQVFDARLLRPERGPVTDQRSIFVLGLPRSGTTLVERILASHPQVDSLGEIDDLAFALIRLAAGPGGKLEMVDRSAGIDFRRLGSLYRGSTAGYGLPGPWLIDKTPLNFLYLGLIHLALPGARVVHVRRHPLASCHAMYKSLFRMGYPFSYSLEDIGHYYVAYHRLMAHWRAVIPQSFVDLDYETLVDQQEAASRGLVQHCGLEWDDACLTFHRNASPSATASAVQVRRPLYRTSVDRWRSYERQLEPLARMLESNGIDCA
jgi:hypothetical protein